MGCFVLAQCILSWADVAQLPPMTPEPAPTIKQLLAFYLEAGVDCALADEAVNRLSDPAAAAVTAPAASEPALPQPVRPQPAVMPAMGPRAHARIAGTSSATRIRASAPSPARAARSVKPMP